ncbi:hypothetical protein [Klebsiella pneumoniae]
MKRHPHDTAPALLADQRPPRLLTGNQLAVIAIAVVNQGDQR